MEAETDVPLVADDEDDSGGDKNLDVALNRLERFLAVLGFPESPSRARLAASCAAFLLLGIAVPSAAICLSRCSQSRGDEYEVQQFELCVLVSEASLAAVSLVAVSRNLLKYGVRRFLFVDQHHGQVDRLQQEYVCQIQVSSVVQVIAVVLCLNAASKISHRAQGVASLASRWHAYVACCPADPQMQSTNSSWNLEAIPASSSLMDYSESNSESLENMALHNNAQLSSFVTSYHKRQALDISILHRVKSFVRFPALVYMHNEVLIILLLPCNKHL
ncbi:hypothetical protein MUK42_26594, partial [Musa troglodytarum]